MTLTNIQFRSSLRWAVCLVAIIALMMSLGVVSAQQAQAATRTCSSSTPADQRPTLREGDRGSCVKIMQQLASKDSQVNLVADGVFGPKTKTGVKAYQSRHGLVSDGIVGRNTWRSLVGSGSSTPPVGTSYQCGNTGSRVLLVFDDYPLSSTGYKALIDEAERLNIGIGVAPNGKYVKSGRADIDYVRRAGMYPVDHTYNHPDLTKLSYSAIYKEITTSGVSTKWGRPPFGALNSTVRRAYDNAGMNLCLWTVDPRDWDGRSARSAADFIVSNSRRGSTVVVHLNHLGTDPSQLSRIKSGLSKRGLYLCRPHSGTTPEDWRPSC